MPIPYRPMLASLPTGDDVACEVKVDGWRCCCELSNGRVRIWTRGGGEWSAALPELSCVSELGDDVVLDGELAVVTADGRADFELLSGRMMTPAGRPRAATVSLYVFDLLRMGDKELLDQPWTVRSSALEDLDPAAVTAGCVRVVSYTTDAATMWDATRAAGAEGLVIKDIAGRYAPGRRVPWWKKVKHRSSDWFVIAGWRRPTTTRPGGLVLSEDDEPIGTATLAMPAVRRAELAEVIRRYGRHHPTGMITMPPALQAKVRYTSRTPTYGHLREAVAVAVAPVANDIADTASLIPTQVPNCGNMPTRRTPTARGTA